MELRTDGMEGSGLSRRRAAAWALGVVTLATAAAIALVAYVTFVLPARIEAMSASGATDLPRYLQLVIQTSNFITTKWLLLIWPLALILALLASRRVGRRMA